ncbi:MAG: hypothetical protein R3F24_12345 [Gammaproteobacteria bacterium]
MARLPTEPSFLSRVIWWLIMMYIGTAAVAYALLGLGLLGWHSRPTLYGIATAAVAYAIYSALTPDFLLGSNCHAVGNGYRHCGLARHVAKPGAWMAIRGAAAIVLAAVPQQLQWGVPSPG